MVGAPLALFETPVIAGFGRTGDPPSARATTPTRKFQSHPPYFSEYKVEPGFQQLFLKLVFWSDGRFPIPSSSAPAGYLRGLTHARSHRSAGVGRLAALDEPLAERPTAPEAVIDLLTVSDPGYHGNRGGFLGFVHGGCLPAALAANWLAGAWTRTRLCLRAARSLPARRIAQRWLVELLDMPEECTHAFVTGPPCQLYGLAAARGALLERLGGMWKPTGLFGAPPLTSSSARKRHPSVTKRSVAGLGPPPRDPGPGG